MDMPGIMAHWIHGHAGLQAEEIVCDPNSTRNSVQFELLMSFQPRPSGKRQTERNDRWP
jgi:hypothetical protein